MILLILGLLLIVALFAAITAVIVAEGGWETAAFAWGVTLVIAAVAGAGSLLIVHGLHQ